MKSILALLFAAIAAVQGSDKTLDSFEELAGVRAFKTIDLKVPEEVSNFRCNRGICHLKKKESDNTILLASHFSDGIDDTHCDDDDTEDIFKALLEDHDETKGFGYDGINFIVEKGKAETLNDTIDDWKHKNKLALTIYIKDYLNLKDQFGDKWAEVVKNKLLHVWIVLLSAEIVEKEIKDNAEPIITWVTKVKEQTDKLFKIIPVTQKIVSFQEVDLNHNAFASEEMCIAKQ